MPIAKNHPLGGLLVVAITLAAVVAPPLPAQEPVVAAPAEASAEQSVTTGANTDLLDLNLDQLSRQDVVAPALDTAVTSVSRQESTIGRSPAAVFVITPEMIRRSGATCIPEVLRMVPGLEVAKVDSNNWAISARGFNNHFADKLLVQIDRRVVYSPLFGGVYWDVQDVVLEDVERIEVIRGPGTTAWGSNAVNGVINIYTKKAKDTQGALVVSGGGDQEKNFNTVRYGGQSGNNFHWRVYGKEFERNHGYAPGGAFDDWRQGRGGFRGDWAASSEDFMTVQGDVYNGISGNGRLVGPNLYTGVDTHVQGGNALFRWTRTLDDDTEWQFQSYFDQAQRHSPGSTEDRRTMDFDFQARFAPGRRQRIVYGANYRRSQDSTTGTPAYQYFPPRKGIDWASLFIEDRITLVEDRWYFIPGGRLEYQTYGKVQAEPSARLLFLPDERHSCWAAVSRAARNPTRVNTELSIEQPLGGAPPMAALILGNPKFAAEHLMAYELGYRAQPIDDFSWDVACFVNRYEDLAGLASQTPFFSGGTLFFPTSFANNMSATSCGAELSANLQLTDSWKIYGTYTFTQINVSGPDVSTAATIEGSTPRNQFYTRSSWDVGRRVQFDVIGRYVDTLPALNVPHYFTMDLRLGWQPTRNTEFAVVGQNLLDRRHFEFIDTLDTTQQSTEVVRGVYGSFTWRR